MRLGAVWQVLRMWTQENRARHDRSKPRHPSDLTDEEWALVNQEIARAKRGGNKRTVDVREVVDGLMCVLGTGCQWSAIPKEPPPRSTGNHYFCRWSYDGTLDRLHHVLYQRCRELTVREASPTAAIIDSQSVKSAEKGRSTAIRQALMRVRRAKARNAISSSTRKAC
jgi:transposase